MQKRRYDDSTDSTLAVLNENSKKSQTKHIISIYNFFIQTKSEIKLKEKIRLTKR